MLDAEKLSAKMVFQAHIVVLVGGTLQLVDEIKEQLFPHLLPDQLHLFSCDSESVTKDRHNFNKEQWLEFIELAGSQTEVHVVVLDFPTKLCIGRAVKCTEHNQELQHESAVNILLNLSNLSTLESLLDLMAGGILWFTHLSLKNINIYRYPIGKLQVQPVGIIVFVAIMATLGFQVRIEVVRKLIEDKGSTKISHSQLEWIYIIMLFANGVKLALWLYCKTSKSEIVQVYAKAHYFDLVINVVGLVTTVLGEKLIWWIDLAREIVLALYTIIN